METVLDQDAASRVPDRLPPGDPRDLVVLLDDDHKPRGTASRSAVHSHYTPLHLAFSCYLFDADDRLLVTRRSLAKRSWPGVWTNSFCGHPRPQESLLDAIRRHGRSELGVDAHDIRPVLPQFSYRAVDAAGVVENEFCPVFVARAGGVVEPHPDEVAELQWVTVDDLRAAIKVAPWAVSPWLVAQTRALDEADAWHLLRPVETDTAP